MPKTWTFACIADTHNKHKKITMPPADVAVAAGDFTVGGTINEALAFLEWYSALPHKHKLLIAGNHDYIVESMGEALFDGFPDIVYLEGGTYDFGGKGPKVYAGPWTPRFTKHRMAFNRERGEEMRATWAKIPKNTDVLVTHGPPLFYGDLMGTSNVGDLELLERLKLVKPRLHICGHVHGGYGIHTTTFGTTVVNAAMNTSKYSMENTPLLVTVRV